MKTKFLTTLLALAVLAVPAAVPASQPADIRLDDLRSAAGVTVAPAAELAMLLQSTQAVDDDAFVIPTGVIKHDWVSSDPFAR